MKGLGDFPPKKFELQNLSHSSLCCIRDQGTKENLCLRNCILGTAYRKLHYRNCIQLHLVASMLRLCCVCILGTLGKLKSQEGYPCILVLQGNLFINLHLRIFSCCLGWFLSVSQRSEPSLASQQENQFGCHVQHKCSTLTFNRRTDSGALGLDERTVVRRCSTGYAGDMMEEERIQYFATTILFASTYIKSTIT